MDNSCPCCGAADKRPFLSCHICGFADDGFAGNLENAYFTEFGRLDERRSGAAAEETADTAGEAGEGRTSLQASSEEGKFGAPRVRDALTGIGGRAAAAESNHIACENREARATSCPSCGKMISEGRGVCLFCGTELPAADCPAGKKQAPPCDPSFNNIYDPWDENGLGTFVKLFLALAGVVLGVITGAIVSATFATMGGHSSEYAIAGTIISIVVSCIIMGVYIMVSLRKNYLVAECRRNPELAEYAVQYSRNYYHSVFKGVYFSFTAAIINYFIGSFMQYFSKPHDANDLFTMIVFFIIGVSVILTIKGIYSGGRHS